MGAIYWNTLTWEAFAQMLTVVVGAGAIFGTYRVGMRQVELQKQIADEAQATERLKIKTDLFEHRMQVYEDVRRWLGGLIMSGNQVNNDDQRAMLAAIDRSQFLFHKVVTIRLRNLYGDAFVHGAMKAIREHESLSVSDMNKADDAWARLVAASDRLYELFGEELRLGSEGPVTVEAVGRASSSSRAEGVGGTAE